LDRLGGAEQLGDGGLLRGHDGLLPLVACRGAAQGAGHLQPLWSRPQLGQGALHRRRGLGRAGRHRRGAPASPHLRPGILLDADPDYLKTLQSDSNAHRRKAWLEGSWDIVAGGLFDDLWDPRVHVVEAFPVPESWRVDRSFDWGSTQPFSVGWWAESDGTDATLADGTTRPTVRGDLYRIAEWYGWSGKPNDGLKMTARKVALGILERERDLGLEVRPGPADSHIFADARIGRDIAAEMAAAGVHWTKAHKGSGSRLIGAERLRALLAGALPRSDGPREQPGLFVFAGCRAFIRTVPVLPRGTGDPDDVDTNAEDHVYDETRYRIMARKGLGGEKRVGGMH
jgi:hypothetical protein